MRMHDGKPGNWLTFMTDLWAMFRQDSGSTQFQSTSWSLVVAAAGHPTEAAEIALAKLCRLYWYPVYAFTRRRGHSEDDARDLTQEFFCRVIQHHYLRDADPSRGRFRSFLLTAARHFMANEWRRERAVKRGGGAGMLSFEIETAERRYSLELADREDPERLYQRRWAISTIEQALFVLRQEYDSQGKLEQFDRLAPLLTGTCEESYADIARKWNSTEGAVKVSVHRLRKQYRALLRRQIAETVAHPEDVDDEIRFLLSALEMQR